MTISWTPGDGTGSIVLMKQGSAVDASPADGMSYTANSVFGYGSEIGIGNYAVYTGNDTEVTVTGLTPGATYHIAIYTYNTNPGTNYLTANPGIGSQTTNQVPMPCRQLHHG